MRRTRPLTVLVSLLTLGACARPGVAGLSISAAPTSAAISADDLRLRAGILAHDSLRGRDTGTPGAASAARYIAAELERLGFRPAGDDGSYLQRAPLNRVSSNVTISLTRDGATSAIGLDQIVPLSGIAGLPEASLTAGSGPLVFAGHLVDPALPGGELTADQIRGSIVMLRIGIPAGVDPSTASPRPTLAPLFSPASTASAVFLIAEDTEAELWDYASEIAHKGELLLGTPEQLDPGAPPFFLITTEAAEALLGVSLSQSREPRTDLGTIEYTLTEETTGVEGWNVVGVLPGRDPQRAGEFMALGGHYDHVGVGVAVDGDSIYNGADDNASGTSALLEIAESLALLSLSERPARSTLFVWHTAEEAGLLGSEHFTNHPTVPRGAITAHVNIDMMGRNSPDSIFVVGASRLSSELAAIVEEVNRELPRPFALDYSYDPEGHPEMIYCRSDHYNYARLGIPIVFLTTGMHEDYHAPSDEVGKLDYTKMQHVSEYVLNLTREIADRPSRLVVDKPVPPLGSPCI